MGWLAPVLDLIRRRYFGAAASSTAWGPEDWTRSVTAALVERLGPVAGEAASSLDVQLPQPCWALLTAARLQNEQRVRVHSQALRELGLELEAAGLVAVLFKGLATGRHYPDVHVRETGDIDLLVSPGQVDDVAQILLRSGFDRQLDAERGKVEPPYAATYVMTHASGEELGVELHPEWHEVTISAQGPSVHVGPATYAVERAEIGGFPWHVLPSAAELYLGVSHAVLHNPRTLSVYLDAGVLLNAFGGSVLGDVADLAKANGRERHLRHTLSAASDLFGTRVERASLSLPTRVGVPAAARLGYLGFGYRFLPSTVVLEVAWRKGLRRKLRFLSWLMGHGRAAGEARGGVSRAGLGARWRRLLRLTRGVHWLRGVLLKYRVPGSPALRR